MAIALAFVTDQTTATTGRSIEANGGGVTLEADGSAASLVSSNASASGGPTATQESQEPQKSEDTSKEGPNSETKDSNSVDGQDAQERNLAESESGTLSDSKGNSVKVHDTGQTKTPAASTSDGGVTVAAAVAVNVVDSEANAFVPAGLTITATGPLTVTATNDTGNPANTMYIAGTISPTNPNPNFGDSPAIIGDTANAWGSASGTSKLGIGAAVALNLVDASTEAEIQSSSTQPTTINTEGAIVNAGMVSGSPGNSFGANSTSGSGATDIGVAGAVAINIVSDTSQALIETGASVNAHRGDVSVTSANTSTDTTTGTPLSPASGGSLGIGASLALNVISDTTQSEVQDGAALTNAGNVTVTAAGTHAIVTWSQNGASGKVALGGGIAIAIVSAPTTAYVGSDTQTLNASGTVTIGASGAFSVNSVAAAATNTSGAGLGLGASVVVNVAQDSFQAELDRDVTTSGVGPLGAVSITASPVTSSSQAAAIASEQGAPATAPPSSGAGSGSGSGGTADEEAQNQSSFAHSEGGSDAPDVPAPPKANDETSSPSGDATSKAGSSGATSVGIAGSVAINVLNTSTVARIDNGLNVEATAGGSLTVGTANQSSALALADSRADVNTDSIGAAVSLNVATVTNTATIGAGDAISADGVSVTALMPSDAVNDFSAQAFGVAIGDQYGVAGSAGINVIAINTLASIGGFTGTIASGSNLVTGVGNTSGLYDGETVTGPGIPSGSTIQSIGPAPGTITLSNSMPASPESENLTASPSGSPVAGTVTSGSNSVTGISDTTGLFDGEIVTGNGIPAGTTITGIGPTSTIPAGTITLSANVTLPNAAGPVSETLSGLPSTIVGTLNGTQVTGISSTAGLNVGETVTGTGIPAGTTITKIDSSTSITLSAPFDISESLSGSPTTVTSSGGLSVQTEDDETLQDFAFTGAEGGDAGVGAAVDVNVLNNTTNAFLASEVQANVADQTQVTSESSLNPFDGPYTQFAGRCGQRHGLRSGGT